MNVNQLGKSYEPVLRKSTAVIVLHPSFFEVVSFEGVAGLVGVSEGTNVETTGPHATLGLPR